MPEEQTPFEESNTSKKEKNILKKTSKKPVKANARAKKNKVSKKENKPKIMAQRQNQIRKTIKSTAKMRNNITIYATLYII